MHIQAALAVGSIFLCASLAAAAAPPKACSLLTPEIAATLAGGPVGPPTDLGKTICGYRPKSGGGSIGLAVEQVEPAEEAKAIDVLRMTAGSGAKTEVIAGLGDQALLVEKPESKNVLIATLRGNIVSLGVPGAMTEALRAAMIKAMAQMLGKL